MTLVLRDEEVRDLVSMGDAIEALETALRSEVDDTAVYAERSNLLVPGGWYRMAPAALLDEGVAGYKEFHLANGGIRFSVRLFALDDGRPLAEMDGKHLTAVRTGAAGGLGLRRLASPTSRVVGVIGSSDTAWRQLEAAATVLAIDEVRVHSRTPANRERFAARVTDILGLPATAVASTALAAGGADVLLVATDTRGAGPAVGIDGIGPGTHINSIGSTLPNQREVDTELWRAVDRLVVDTAGVLADSGDAIAAVAAGAYDESKVATLRQLEAGERPGRTDPAQITMYKSVGTSVQDVAVALMAYRRAVEKGLGDEAADFVSVKVD